MLNILLLEDEYYTRRFLKKLVSENPLVKRVFDTPSGKEAISLAGKHHLDIAFLDIELAPKEKLNGIQVAKKIYSINREIYFVFITGYSEYAIESFAVHPYDYILKPVKKDQVNKTINNLAVEIKKTDAVGSGSEKLVLKVKNKTIILTLEDVIFLEKQDKQILIHTRDYTHKVTQTMNELEVKLGANFARVHRSFIANLDKIDSIKNIGNRSYEISFTGYDKVALMSRYKFEEHKHKFAFL